MIETRIGIGIEIEATEIEIESTEIGIDIEMTEIGMGIETKQPEILSEIKIEEGKEIARNPNPITIARRRKRKRRKRNLNLIPLPLLPRRMMQKIDPVGVEVEVTAGRVEDGIEAEVVAEAAVHRIAINHHHHPLPTHHERMIGQYENNEDR